jgi:lysophospholipase L1-like esterase
VTLVAALPTLRFTRFMAFGDSITAGEVNSDTYTPPDTCNDPAHPAGGAALRDTFRTFTVQADLAYPNQLQQLLAARYTDQTFTMFNEGQPLDDTGDFVRFAGVLRADRPEAVLLMQGIIDVAGRVPVPTIVANLDSDIAEARRQGVAAIFLSTITPVVYEHRGCFLTNPDIRAANDAIRALALRDNVYAVDAYAAIIGQESTLMGVDGLHPTPAGYRAIAQAFFAVIQSGLEAMPAPVVASRSHRP